MVEGPRLSRYFALFAIAWVIAMMWRIYPQFKDAVRVDGRLTTVDDYVDGTCGERVGPAAATCLAEAREEAQRLLRHDQGKSILLIEAPILGYLLIYLPIALWQSQRRVAPRGLTRERMRSAAFLFLATTLALMMAAPSRAHADAQQTQSFAVWRQMQECAKQATKQFPDHTPDGNAKREAARQECLRAHHLPVTSPVVSPPPR